ncbi:sigma-70 family RNA polymerase sigma factor [Flavobacterium silvisoli]|uniref:Sigma-70 family RNA polymerase sigma factor n=1 Tax=Flavobacterium silvisoli TaxID=2529433 RepID=A0A4Q9Z1Y3_9FLAO|nr:sigma-70 family RNA polymerase sigma factor [Flavobacterium silvisoli]TBX70374.1 sigma-70 family RNA polymerase sigma factor [Flavobacterium silvisoli]
MEHTDSNGICEELVFSRFFKANVKSLRNYLYFKFGNEEKANDITQESFIKLWENCKNVPLEKAKSYIYTIANNASLNEIAHQKVVLKYAQSQTQKDRTNLNPEFLIEEEQFKQKLEKAIDSLTEAQRTAFLLHRIEGKKYHEIAVILDISVKAVEKRIHGALITLRTEIEQFK